MYPPIFRPTDIELLSVGIQIYEIPKCFVKFDRWTGEPIKETFGGKPLVEVDNQPMFAELAIMSYFAKYNWDVRWVETYGKNKPIYMTAWKDDKYKNQTHRPFENEYIDTLLADIAKLNGNSYSGCWDVLAYKDHKVVFAESKRLKKDSIRTTQTNWLTAALRHGLRTDNFLIVQWDM